MVYLPAANARRHFLSWDRPLLGQVVEWLAAGWTGKGPLDLSDVLVLVPTRQAGRRLREALAAHAATHAQAAFPPRVLTPDALVAQDPGSDAASRVETLLAWVELFRTIELEDFRVVFPVAPPARTFAWAMRLAQQFTRLQATLAENGLRLADVAARVGSDFVEAGRWAQLAELERRYVTQLAKRGRRDPQAARIAAATAGGAGEFARCVVLAVPDPQPLALTRLAAMARGVPVEVVVFAPESEAGAFDDWGRPLVAAWERRVLELEDFETRVHLCADPAAQAVRIAAVAASYPEPEGRLALGLADPEITPLLANELARVERQAFNPEGQPLAREGLFELLSCLAALARDPSFAAVSALARCPDFISHLRSQIGGSFSAAHWLAQLDELRARHLPGDLASASEFAVASAGRFEVAARGLDAMEKLRRALNTGTFAASVAGVLQEIFSGRALALERGPDARLHAAAAMWMETLRECAAAAARFGALAPAESWELALRIFGEQRRTEDKPAGALELQGWLELLWEDAPHLVVAGCNDGWVPEAVVDDPFLPESLRERLGLRTNAARFARDAYLLQAIAAARRTNGRLDLFLGKTSAAGEPLRPSRLLLRCRDEVLPDRIAFLFRAAEVAEASAAWTRAWKLTPRAVAPPPRVAVTALRSYLQCPFRFYLRHALGMEAVDPLKTELDARDFGTLCHTALEQIGRDPTLRDCTDAAVLRAELLRRVDAAVLARYGTNLSLPLLVQVESARQRVGKLAELQAGERAAGWEILHVERPFEIELNGVVIRGKIDRIDRHAATGAVRVLDYKTSDSPVSPGDAHLRPLRAGETVREWMKFEAGERPRVWVDLQLPLYRHALGGEFSAPITCGYFNLPKAAGETTLALWEDYTPELHADAMRCAEAACAAIRTGEFWPPNETLRADRDDCAALFHHGVAESVDWPCASETP